MILIAYERILDWGEVRIVEGGVWNIRKVLIVDVLCSVISNRAVCLADEL
jgi:hypothetical protein